MLRVTRDSGVKVDPRQRLPGRGAYVHRDLRCVEDAVSRGGLARTLRCGVPAGLADDLRAQLAEEVRTR